MKHLGQVRSRKIPFFLIFIFMDTDMQAKNIRNLIGKSKLKEALQDLEQMLDGTDMEDDAFMLKAQYEDNKKKNRRGIISNAEMDIAQNKLRSSILDLLHEVKFPSKGIKIKSGDQISRDKIERQININQGDYIENQVNMGSSNQMNTNSTEKSSSDDSKTVLFAAANPTNTGRIQIDKEHNIIEEEMQRGSKREGYTFLPPKFAARINDLIRALKSKPFILHFAGHGEQEGILLSDNNNKSLMLQDDAIKRLFKPLIGHTQLVLLNNCYSAQQAELISTFGMYVIGHRMPVTDIAALSFAKGFYLGLGEGMNFEDAYNDALTIVLAENVGAKITVEVWKDGKQLNW